MKAGSDPPGDDRPVLQVDAGNIERFVSNLFRHAEEGSYVSLPGFDQVDRGRPSVLIRAVPINGSLNTVVSAAVIAARDVANSRHPAVFAPPVATFDNDRKAGTANLKNGLAISVELDGGDTGAKRRQIESLLGRATVVMHSGGEWLDDKTGEVHRKMHLHWRLSEPTTTVAEHQQLQFARWLAAVLVDADRTAAPSAHPLRWPGSWNLKGTPRLAEIADEEPDAEVHLDEALAALQEAVEAAGLDRSTPSVDRASSPPQAPVEVVASALAALPNVDVHWDEWVRVGMATWNATGGAAAGLAAWEEWSARSGKHVPDACVERWSHFAGSPPTRIGAGTLILLAKMQGWQDPRYSTRTASEPPDAHPDDPGPQPDGTSRRHELPPRKDAEPTEKRWTVIDPTKWADPPPARRWIVDGWLPVGVVTGFYGDGAAGKSTIAQQLMVSTALGLPWLGMPTTQGRVFALMCEDDESELHRRQAAVNAAYGVGYGDLEDMRIVSRVGEDNFLMSFEAGDVGLRTENWQILRGHIADFRPSLVVLDTLADVFGGDEIRRGQARQFIQGACGSLAREFDCAVVVCAHPSLSGMQSGAGTGGSTAWNNTVRSRWYLTTPVPAEDEVVDPDVRVLNRMKNNYGPRGGEIKLRWDAGTFRLDGIYTPKAKPEWNQIEAIFTEVARAWMAGKPWSNALQTKDAGRYLPLWASTTLGCNERIVKNHVQKWLAGGFLAAEQVNSDSKLKGLRVLKFLRQGDVY